MVVAALAFGVVASEANAQTTTVNASAYTYSGLMKVGMKGPGISTLQAALNSVQNSPQVVVDGSFGPATLSAVKAFQMSKGLKADGVVGMMTGTALANATVAVITIPSNGCPAGAMFNPTTGAKCSTGGSLPAGCTSTSGFSPSTGMSCSSGSSSNGSLNGGETSIDSISVDDADDDTIDEGDTKAPVADIQFDVNDADAQLVRADVVFQSDDSQTGEETKPWRAFDKVYLMDGSKVLATVDASDQDNWDDAADLAATTDNQAYRVRFNSVNQVYKEDSNNNELWVAVDVNDSVDGSDTDNADWVVGVEANGLRFTDGAGLDTEETTSDTATFSIIAAGQNSGFTVTKDSSTPDAQTLEVDQTSSTTATIAVFKIKTDTDGGDVKIDNFPITLAIAGTGSKNVNDVVSDVFVVVDGTTYSTDDSPTATTSQTFEFSDIEDDDVIVDAGDTMTVTVKVKLKSQGSSFSSYANGVTITASAALDVNDVEDSESGDDIGDVNGTSTAETMTLASNGIMVDIKSADTTITDIDNATNDVATFTWKFDVTAFGDDDVYINKDFADVVLSGGSSATDVDTIYLIDYSGGAALTSQSGTVATNSSADLVTADASAYVGAYSGEVFYKIASGDTETFTVTVTGTNQTDNKQVRAHLTNLEFTTDDVTSATAQDATAATIQSYTADLSDDSETPFKSLQ